MPTEANNNLKAKSIKNRFLFLWKKFIEKSRVVEEEEKILEKQMDDIENNFKKKKAYNNLKKIK